MEMEQRRKLEEEARLKQEVLDKKTAALIQVKGH
jgi:hypothetical protein